MHAEFWLERWRDGRTHFHQETVTPWLTQYWPRLGLPANSQVLVPLAGKSLDMLWLAAQGHRVVGVELSQLAIAQFLSQHQLSAETHESASGQHYCCGNIELICGDIFAIEADILAKCAGIYDRAALIALPPAMRAQYVRHVYGGLADEYRGLLITLDYPQEQMEGPPFSVADAEVQGLSAPHTCAVILERHAMLAQEPKFAQRGVTRLDTVLYQMQRKTGQALDAHLASIDSAIAPQKDP